MKLGLGLDFANSKWQKRAELGQKFGGEKIFENFASGSQVFNDKNMLKNIQHARTYI